MTRFDTHEQLLSALRSIDTLKEKGKTRGTFYFKSRPFLHFHNSGAHCYADLRRSSDWERIAAATPKDRAALFAAVIAFLS